MLIRRIILLLIIIYCNVAFADTVATNISSDKVVLGETFVITFSINNTSDINPDFSVLQKDFAILSTQRGTSISMFNGAMTAKTSWQLVLEPKHAGTVTIPEITFGNEKSAAQTLAVEQQTVTSSDESKQSQPVFIKAEVSNLKPYIQSQVLYKLKLFYSVQLENLRLEFPQIKDALLVQVGDTKNYNEKVNGNDYFVAEKDFAIFPQKIGHIIIPTVNARALADINDSNYGFYASLKPINLSTPSFNLNVQPIPNQFQNKNWLPAKNISMSETWSADTNHWEVGTPITRKIVIKAEGLRADQLPDLNIDKIPDANMYVDPPKRSNAMQADAVLGTLETKITYIPNAATTLHFPPLQLNWWNTDSNSPMNAQLNALTVNVKPATVNNIQTTPAQPVVVAPKTIEQPKQVESKAYYSSMWFWFSVILLILWLSTVAFIWLRKPKIVSADTSTEARPQLNDKGFAVACKAGDSLSAQQYLLAWGKRQWQDAPLSLDSLANLVVDENFKNEIKTLEKALYAKKHLPWDGQALLVAYQQNHRHKKTINASEKLNKDPLPPLYPNP